MKDKKKGVDYGGVDLKRVEAEAAVVPGFFVGAEGRIRRGSRPDGLCHLRGMTGERRHQRGSVVAYGLYHSSRVWRFLVI